MILNMFPFVNITHAMCRACINIHGYFSGGLETQLGPIGFYRDTEVHSWGFACVAEIF